MGTMITCSVVQWYLGIEGFCGFHAECGVDAPWLMSKQPRKLGPPLSREELLLVG
jgi:hypothetical protein